MILAPRIMERTTNLIDLMIPWTPGITQYRILGHSTLQGAFTAPDTIFDVAARTSFASPSVLARNHFHQQDELRNTQVTRVRFDLNDYSLPSNDIPTDGFILYLRLQAFSQALGGFLPAGTIVPIPAAVSYGSQKLHVTLAGVSPIVAGIARGDNVPDGAMCIMLPGVADVLDIANQDAGNTLLYAFGEGDSLAELDSGVSQDFDGSRIKYIYLVSTAAVQFSSYAALRAD